MITVNKKDDNRNVLHIMVMSLKEELFFSLDLMLFKAKIKHVSCYLNVKNNFFKGFLIKKNPSFKDHVPIKKAGSYGNSDNCPHQDRHQQNVLLSLM